MASPKKKIPSKRPASRRKVLPPKKKPSKTSPIKTKRAKSEKSSKAESFSIVPVHPKTGKELKTPTGKDIYYGVKNKQGKIKVLSKTYTQKFSKKDLDGLNQILKKAGDPNNFVYYEELTKEALRDKSGKIIYRKRSGRFVRDAKGKKIPHYKTKVTYAKEKKKQAPILRARGRDVRKLDIGYRERSARERPEARFILPLATRKKAWSKEIVLMGDTLQETVKQIQVPMSLKEFQKKAPDGLSVRGRLKVARPGEEHLLIMFYTTVYILANFAREVSQAMRFKLADQGYRFTSLVTLETLAEEYPEYAKRILFVGKDKKPVESLTPLFPENEFGYPDVPKTHPSSPSVSLVLSITAA